MNLETVKEVVGQRLMNEVSYVSRSSLQAL